MADSNAATAWAERGTNREGPSLHVPWIVGAGPGVCEGSVVVAGMDVFIPVVIVLVTDGAEGMAF